MTLTAMKAALKGRTYTMALLVASLALPAAARAQEETIQRRPPAMQLEREGPGGSFDLLGFVGWLAPLADLTMDPETFTSVLNPNLSLGVDATFWINRSFGFGVQGFYSPTEVQIRPLNPMDEVIPGNAADVDYWSATANLVWRPGVTGPAATVQPFFSIGGGLRRLSAGEVLAPTVTSSTDPAGTLGAGVIVRVLGSLNVRTDLRYHVSTYKSGDTGDSKIQNDLVVVFGIGWRAN